MLSRIKLRYASTFFKKGGVGRAINLIRHRLTYPKSRYVLGGGINIMPKCNLRCSFCSSGFFDPDKKLFDAMSAETFDRILNLEVFKHAFYFSFGTGEPFLHKQLFLFIRKVQQRGMVILIATNGTMIQRRMTELLETPPDVLWVSLYDEVLEKQMTAMKELQPKKPKKLLLGATRIFRRHSMEEMKAFIDRVGQIGVENLWFQQLNWEQAADGAGPQRLYEGDREALDHIRSLEEYRRNRYPRMNVSFPKPIPTRSRTFFCLSLYKGMTVDYNGAIQPCCFLNVEGRNTYGNLLEDELAHITNPVYLALKSAFQGAGGGISRTRGGGDVPETCKGCSLLNFNA